MTPAIYEAICAVNGVAAAVLAASLGVLLWRLVRR